jgi:hypothetical protein
MTVDGVTAEPCDPLFLTPGFRYYDLDEDRAADGREVTVREKDHAKPPRSSEEAWQAWRRAGVSQLRLAAQHRRRTRLAPAVVTGLLHSFTVDT